MFSSTIDSNIMLIAIIESNIRLQFNTNITNIVYFTMEKYFWTFYLFDWSEVSLYVVWKWNHLFGSNNLIEFVSMKWSCVQITWAMYEKYLIIIFSLWNIVCSVVCHVRILYWFSKSDKFRIFMGNLPRQYCHGCTTCFVERMEKWSILPVRQMHEKPHLKPPVD